MKTQKLSNQVIKAAICEIEGIKKHATDEEKARLKFCKLIPSNSEECIYGQMTGDCYSQRATQLINKTHCGVIKNIKYTHHCTVVGLFNFLFEKIQRVRVKLSDNTRLWHTCLENIIACKSYIKYNQNTLTYIRGETKTLKLRELLK